MHKAEKSGLGFEIDIDSSIPDIVGWQGLSKLY